MAKRDQVKFQGETYDSPDDAAKSVQQLIDQAEELPEESEQRAELLAHAEGLARAAGLLPEDEPAPEDDPDSERQDEGEGDIATEPGTAAAEPDEADRTLPAGFVACPLCAGGGIVPTELRQDPSTRTCPTCEGMGLVYTGSLVEASSQRSCPDCGGAGFQQQLAAVRSDDFAAPEQAAAAPLPPEAFPIPAPVEAGANGDQLEQPAPAVEPAWGRPG